MSMYKTQAIRRLEAFFAANYNRMYGIAVKEVGEHLAWDVVNNTYLELIDREERGRGHYNESYGSKFDTYVYSVLYSTLKALRKASMEITESDMVTYNADGEETTSYIENVATYDDLDGALTFVAGPMEICSEFVAACDSCDTDVEALVRAIRQPENLSSCFISKFFSSLRKAAKADCTIISAVEDFIQIYRVKPQEVNMCLLALGVQA